METDSRIVPVNIEDTMQDAYLEYAMSVIVGRALPDVRDGLKPVHRRIMFAMHEMGNTFDKAYKKSARVVGDVIGKYHPHGDQAVYDALVRLAQDFSLRYTLVDGQGNFGSIDGDAAAAMRYTEVRLQKISSDILADLEKETVDFGPNYDGTQHEPTVLPSRVPNLLVNGSSGIAVGMSTNIPPHNMGEVVDACLALIDNPATRSQEINQIVKGPDFPGGGIIVGMRGIVEAYSKGHGIIRIKGRSEIETYGKDSRERIVITQLPYQVNKARLIERIAELVREREIEGVSDLRDESDRTGIRVVIELKKDVASQVVLNQLLKFTQLQVSFGIQMIAIDGKRPRLFNLKEILQAFITHRREVVTRRSVFELKEAEAQAHIVEGLLKAISSIDEIVALIRKAENSQIAKDQLIARYKFSDVQAKAILDMRLARLTGLERTKLENELKELTARIITLKAILESEETLMKVIRAELVEVRQKYADPRKTEILPGEEEELAVEDLIEDEEAVFTFSNECYIKRMPVAEFRAQGRGGKGIKGASDTETDYIRQIFSASVHCHVLCLTNLGRIYGLRGYEIPETSRTAKGRNIVNLVQLGAGEKVQDIIPTKEFKDGEFLVLLTKKGLIKKMEMKAFENLRVSGKIAITLQGEDDAVVGSLIVTAGKDLLIVTENGKLIRFTEEDVRPTGTSSMGVRGITLEEGDRVVGLEVCDDSASLLTVTENGFGKQTPVNEYRKQSRGGKGVMTVKVTDKTGKVVSVKQVKESSDIMIISDGGKMIRTAVSGISSMGRSTQGVRVMNLGDGEKVSAVTLVEEDDGADDVEE